MKINYSKLKVKGKYNFFSKLFLIALMGSQMSWAQEIQKQVIGSYPVMDGGFEGQPIGNISTNAGATTVVASQTKWLNGANSVNGKIENTSNGARSGNNYLSYNMTSGGRQVISPYTTPQLVASTDYILQFYYKASTNPSTNLRGSLFTYDTSAGTLFKVGPSVVTLSPTFSADTWLRASVKITSTSTSGTDPKYINCAAIYDGYTVAVAANIDDVVIYQGSVIDVTAPDAATSPAVAVNGTALDVSWTAPGAGVDGGGYIVVRYAVSPNADNDPNVNGIYAVGNTITNGTGALAGTVVYIGTATSFQDATVVSNTNYYYKIYTVDKAFNYSSEVQSSGIVTPTTSTTWNGSTWSNGTPTATAEAVIEGTYTTTANGGGFTAKKLTVNSGSLTVNTSTNVTVQNEVINNAGTNGIVVENNANLIQVNNTTNTGNVVVKRNSNALSRLDYTLWSSPVTGTQKLAEFSPLTSQSPSRFYTYDGPNNVYATVASPTTTTFAAGTGYLIRMPNTAVAYPSTETFAGVFTGVPNNGTVSLTGLTSDKFYAVGNPYPSVVSADLFLNGNSTGGTLYFWRKTNGIANTGSAYATYTLAGGAGTAAPGNAVNNILPNGKIQVGQGFIVKTGVAATSLQFTNAMREAAPTSEQFLKIKNTGEKSRIWLNLTSGDVFSQALVAYMDGATEGVDNGIDGKYINDSKIALTSDINGEEYTIQGRPAFDAADIVPLNFKTDKAGEYKIAIDHTDGLFAKGQNVYLVDSVTGTETNLTKEAYTFTAESGTANNRFTLKYQSASKTVGSPVFNESTVTVYKNNGTLYVNSAASAIVNIKVFNIQGRLIGEQKDVNATIAAIKNLKATQQVLLVQVTSEDGKVVTKKVVN